MAPLRAGARAAFALVIDIDHFKAYNDHCATSRATNACGKWRGCLLGQARQWPRGRALSADYRKLALILSSAAWPGHSSFSESLLSGVSTVRRCACRSSESLST